VQTCVTASAKVILMSLCVSVSSFVCVCVCVCVGVLPEDSANFTCKIDGPLNTVIASVTHSVVVNGNLCALSLACPQLLLS